jgi:tetratricopeptide (TPR) repeat protein
MRTRLTFAALAVVALGCATPRPRSAVVSLTSAEYAESDSAQSALHRGAYDQAISRADHAVLLGPNDPFAHLTRAGALAGAKETEAALAAYTRAEALYKDDVRGRSLAIYGRAHTLDLAGRCDEARSAYDRYAALVRPFDAASATMATEYGKACRPETPRAPELTAVDELLMRGDNEKALKLAVDSERATLTDQQRAWVDEARGMALTGLGRTKEALAAFDRAAQEVPEAAGTDALRARALWNEARALREAARCDEARAAFERYAKAVPDEADLAGRYAEECPGPQTPRAKRK